jgi:hypothetical protein
MPSCHRRRVRFLLLLVLLPASAFAQSEAPVGVRAAGMGGAFTAVADDASAAFWNPAGFASGSFFSVVADANVLDRRSGWLVALGTPPLGLSYYRAAIAAEKNGRNTLVAHHAGVSLVQSLGGRLAVGTTLKVVHGIATSPGAGSAALSSNKFDADVGVMAAGSLAQLGLSIRNLLEPEFRTPGGAIRLDRRVRAGVSIHAGPETTVAADLDLTTAPTPRGDWREAALGLETRPGPNAWIRGGVHWNTAGKTTAPIGTLGASYAVYGSTKVDAECSFGSAAGDRGWGVGLRFVF